MKIDYYAYQSKMKIWNTEIKMLFSIITLCLGIGFHTIPVSIFIILSMGCLTLFVGKTPWKVYRQYLVIPVSFLILGSLAIAIDISTKAVGDWQLYCRFFYLCITKRGILTAVEVFLKAMAGMSSMFMLAFSTPMSDIVCVLQKLKCPDLFTELMQLIYRYIFILFDISDQMQTAAKARLGYRTFRQSCKSFAGIAGNLFLTAMKKSNQYYDAMIARGYHGKLQFLVEESPVRMWQIMGTVIYIGIIILIGCI